jgi:hypothetical protein
VFSTTLLRLSSNIAFVGSTSHALPSGLAHQYPSESASDAYARILLTKRIGYPLWIPEPANNPRGYEREGVRIGDVGIITFNGGFRCIFNVCLSVNHPLNRRAPPSLEPFGFHHEEDAERRRGIYRRGCVISSNSIRGTSDNSQMEAQG